MYWSQSFEHITQLWSSSVNVFTKFPFFLYDLLHLRPLLACISPKSVMGLLQHQITAKSLQQQRYPAHMLQSQLTNPSKQLHRPSTSSMFSSACRFESGLCSWVVPMIDDDAIWRELRFRWNGARLIRTDDQQVSVASRFERGGEMGRRHHMAGPTKAMTDDLDGAPSEQYPKSRCWNNREAGYDALGRKTR